MEDDMYVIINFHHEEWHFPSYDNLDPAKNQLTKMWAQVADRFKNYDEHLIFEDMNEPRMKGTEYEWTGGTEESRDVINQLNQAFVETIRSSGGNNSLRHLMIPTYAASADLNTWKDFIIPDDGKIIVSVHAYLPYNFTLNGAGTSSWSDDNTNDTKDIDYVMQNLYDAFISKGVPVILGEFGARDKNNLESRTAWAEYYVKRATEKGIPCIIWDNNLFEGNGEKFGLLDRSTLTWKYPEIINALMRGLE
jgi:endoglucanase